MSDWLPCEWLPLGAQSTPSPSENRDKLKITNNCEELSIASRYSHKSHLFQITLRKNHFNYKSRLCT